MDQPHRHAHAGPGAAAPPEPRLLAVLLLTALYLVAEVVGGLLTGSLALLADAGHMLTDALGLGLALFAVRFARRPATPAKTYGFYRAEILAAAANSILLFGIAGYILYEAWRRFNEPPAIQSLPMLLVALGGLLVNLIGVRLLHAGAEANLNVRAAWLEVSADLLGSVGVVLAALVIQLTGWWPADPLVSIAIGAFILPRTWQLLRSALDVLLEATPTHIDVTQLEAVMRAVPGVVSVHDLHVWAITSGFVAMSGHVQASGRPSSAVLHDLRLALQRNYRIEHVTLQVEQPDHADDGACCTLDPRCLIVGSAGAPRGR
jgi:cobalt-zinc-cadmium efflux system protein